MCPNPDLRVYTLPVPALCMNIMNSFCMHSSTVFLDTGLRVHPISLMWLEDEQKIRFLKRDSWARTMTLPLIASGLYTRVPKEG